MEFDELLSQLTSVMNGIKKNEIRKLMKDTFDCASKCASDMKASVDETEACIKKCSAPLIETQNLLSEKVLELRVGLDECGALCAEQARKGLGKSPNDKEMRVFQETIKKCLATCCEEHSKKLPSIKSDIQNHLSKY